VHCGLWLATNYLKVYFAHHALYISTNFIFTILFVTFSARITALNGTPEYDTRNR
jgi:hypothetical protein